MGSSMAGDRAHEDRRALWERIQREAPDLSEFVAEVRRMDPTAKLVHCALGDEVVVDSINGDQRGNA